jgi:hypothetical protein
MATNNTPTTLGSLEFSQIKTNLTDFLRSQSEFSGYNFEGSAIQTIIDLLAYNTFYYAYYANMVNAEAFLDSAQKEDSIISLCKPLGYTVPSKTSSKALIRVSGAGTIPGITAGTLFSTNDENGVAYNFYNLDYIPLVDGVSENFYVYEGSAYVNFDAIPTFDYANQKVSIATQDFDLSTVKVTVSEQIDEVTEYTSDWVKLNNIGYVSQIDDNIYFIERTSSGFAILFGSTNSLGRTIGDTINKIQVRYLKTSGSAANNLSLFTCPQIANSIVTTTTTSFGGKDSPDLNSVRFAAPKYFASQERAVTVNDYKALLIEAGYFTDDTEFNVFGGQDLTPARFGRVFVTTNNPLNDADIDQFINFLKERSIVTVLPEYVISKSLNLFVDFKFGLGASTQNIASNRLLASQLSRAVFNNSYSKNKKYNVTFSASEFINELNSNSNNIVKNLVINPDNFTIYVYQQLLANNDYIFNLGNELELPLSVSIAITEPFDCELDGIKTSTTGKKAILKMYATTLNAKNTQQYLQLWSVDANGVEEQIPGTKYGTFIAFKGSISIPTGIIANTAVLNVKFKNKSVSIGLNNLVTLNVNNITVV